MPETPSFPADEYSNASPTDDNSTDDNSTNSNSTNNNAAESDEIVISIPSDAGYIRVVRLAVMGIASRMALSFEDIEDIKLAVSEACNNAVLHARPNPNVASGKKSPITIRLRTFGDRLEISVEDDGHVASPDLIRPKHIAPTSQYDLPEGGMGLFLIETLMDKVEHETGEKTIVRMTKFLSPHAPQHDEIIFHASTSSAPTPKISTPKIPS